MRKEILFKMKSTYRDDFCIEGYWFGSGEKTACIVGPMRGDEVQQQYICSQIVKALQERESSGEIADGKSILVIPSCNPFSMNVGRRFWAMDSTDINRMFPGYDQGETTQRIAAAVFKHIEGFKYGMQLASFYVPGEFVPHVRMLSTGYEDLETARLFGFPYITTRKPLPFDTTLLNYNWQIWNTSSFSIYAGLTDRIAPTTSGQTVDAVMRFLYNTQTLVSPRADELATLSPGFNSAYIDEDSLTAVVAHHAGVYVRRRFAGDFVAPGEVLAHIIHPYNGSVLEEVRSDTGGLIFFSHHRPMVFQNAMLYRIKANGK
ncbi:MAG: succinylglutamate desuccinylase/aspartoacylase family protein [Prevotellaceae bacterium]|nr:succinylglutamate desuccinylase/aspartoacylase family protein [Candidatus Minthosoma caballi]